MMIRIHRKKTYIIVVIFLLLVAGASFAVHQYIQWANSPVEKPITIAKSPQNLPVTSKTTPLTTDFFTTRVPENYSIRTSPAKNNTGLLHVSAFEQVRGGKQIAITAGPSTGKLEEAPGYTYRTTYPETYKKVSLPYFSQSPAFQTAQGEITLFIMRTNRFTVISVTSPGGNIEESKRILTSLENEWHWL